MDKSVADVGHKSYLTSSFDSYVDLSLMISAGAGNTAGKYLRSFTGAVTESSYIFIINMLDLVFAEDAYFLFSAVVGTERLCRTYFSFFIHNNIKALGLYLFLKNLNCDQNGRSSSLESSSNLSACCSFEDANDGVDI